MARTYIKVARYRYNFAQDGGAISTITLTAARRENSIPTGAIIIGGTIDIITQLTSGGSATIALGTTAGSSASSLKAATAVASWTVGQLAMVPLFSAATYIKMTADGSVTMTIATATLLTGVMEVHVMYLIP